MKKAFLLSYLYREKQVKYKLVYALTLEEAKSILKDYLDELYLKLFGFKHVEHHIDSETI